MSKFIADFHIHSKYSRAVSEKMNLENLDVWADDKGIKVMGTGDFTHPIWFKEIKEKLEPAEQGLYKLKQDYKKQTLKGTLADTRFILTTEISSIYSRGGKVRRIHNLVFSPNIETVKKINDHLSLIGNLESDGRPILGLDSEKLAEIVFGINPECIIIPAHAWTPWFSIFGSMSGFDSIEECFGKYTDKIFAIETGLSSDPLMNWRLSKLDNIALISNSDSHSLERIGREANIFNTDLSYKSIIEAIKSRDLKKFLATVEFFPEEGKYHFDGHLNCGISWSPEETKKYNGICPKCGKKVTVGVLSRVDKLADREVKPEIFKIGEVKAIKFENRIPFINLVTLDEIIGDAFDLGAATKTVRKEYESLIKAFGSESNILMNVLSRDLALVIKPEVIEGIERVRKGELKIKPGFDGKFGEIKIFTDEDREKISKQSSLF